MVCDTPNVPRTRPATHAWGTRQVKERQKFELENDGFGKLPLRGDWVSTQVAIDEFCERVKPPTSQELRDAVDDYESQFGIDDPPSPEDIELHDEEEIVRDETRRKEIVDRLKAFVCGVKGIKPVMENKLNAALDTFLGDEELQSIKRSWDEVFGTQQESTHPRSFLGNSSPSNTKKGDVRIFVGKTPPKQADVRTPDSPTAGRKLSFSACQTTDRGKGKAKINESNIDDAAV